VVSVDIRKGEGENVFLRFVIREVQNDCPLHNPTVGIMVTGDFVRLGQVRVRGHYVLVQRKMLYKFKWPCQSVLLTKHRVGGRLVIKSGC